MKLVTYLKEDHPQLAFLVNGILYDTDSVNEELPGNMSMFLNYWEDMMPIAVAAEKQLKEGTLGKRAATTPFADAKLWRLFLFQQVAEMVMLSDNMLLQQGVTEKLI
jgi:hypothetical protein